MKQWGWEILKYSTAALCGMLFLQPFADLIRNFLREKPDVVVNITEVRDRGLRTACLPEKDSENATGGY